MLYLFASTADNPDRGEKCAPQRENKKRGRDVAKRVASFELSSSSRERGRPFRTAICSSFELFALKKGFDRLPHKVLNRILMLSQSRRVLCPLRVHEKIPIQKPVLYERSRTQRHLLSGVTRLAAKPSECGMINRAIEERATDAR